MNLKTEILVSPNLEKCSEMVKYVQPPKLHSDNTLFNSVGIQVTGRFNGWETL